MYKMYKNIFFVIIIVSIGAMDLGERPRKKDLSRLTLDSVSNEGEVFSDIKTTARPKELLDNHATTRTVKVGVERIFRVSTGTDGANISSETVPSEPSKNTAKDSNIYVYISIGIISLVVLSLYIVWFIQCKVYEGYIGHQTTITNTWSHVD